MPSVTFTTPDGKERTFEGEVGISVMELAIRHGVDGIVAQCGGACACATCHIYVDEGWLERTGTAQGDEAEMLGFAVDPKPSSRLSCQIRLNGRLDGLCVAVAPNLG